jgi:general secretion pathway protein A
MYNDYFGLQRDPFAMTPDPRVLHMTTAQREAFAGIMYAVLARRGFVALIGEAGTGKTTLLNKLMRTLEHTRAQFSVVFNPMLTSSEFLESALADFGLSNIPVSKAQRLLALHRLLLTADERRVTSVLIVDEAHKLSPEVLEEIRLLSNFERPDGKLLQIILAGQPQLAGILDREDLQQLKQRVAVRLTIERFSSIELQCYITRRWISAGGGDHPFTAGAIDLITTYSTGIPRVVNSICDNALMLAMAGGALKVSADHVKEAARDLAFATVADGVPNTKNEVPLQTRESHEADVLPSVKAAPVAADVPVTIPMLQRYAAESSNNTSVLSRILGRLRLAN